MLALPAILIVVVFLIGLVRFRGAADGRIFLIVFTISTIYYGVLGPWYWLHYQQGFFLGTNWYYALDRVSWVFALTHFIVISVSMLLLGKENQADLKTRSAVSTRNPRATSALLGIGFLSAGYVLMAGGNVAASGTTAGGPFFLIAYQFSDLAIAAILFIATQPNSKASKVIFLVAVYLALAVIAGFRYKIALLLGPLLVLSFMKKRRRSIAWRAGIIVAGVAVAFVFAVMTVARNKFVGIDFDVLSTITYDDLVYGLFAETNLVFGLASALDHFGSDYDFVGFSPIRDIFVQFIPRFLYADKDLYGHLVDVAYGISNSTESQQSGTTIPFFGEYFVMFGWWGYAVGTSLYAMLAVFLIKRVRALALTSSQFYAGIGLVAVFIGYYYFSRGAVAQIFKGFIFVCLPYLYLLMSARGDTSARKRIST